MAKQGLRIVNVTQLRTDHLRAFFVAGIKAMGASCANKTIMVGYRRRRGDSGDDHMSGWAQYGRYLKRWDTDTSLALVPTGDLREGRTMRMAIGGNLRGRALDGDAKREFARVFEHEVLHWLGRRHRQMSVAQMKCDGPMPDWAAELPLWPVEVDLSVPREAKVVALVEARREHARKKATEYDAKLRRVQKLAKKWRAKVRYYDLREQRAAKRAK